MFNMDAWRDYLERMRKADDTRWKSGGEGVSEHEIIITTGTTNKYNGDKSDRVNVKLTLAARCQVLEAENAALKAERDDYRDGWIAVSNALNAANKDIVALKAERDEEKERHAKNHAAWTAANEELRDAHQRALNERDAARAEVDSLREQLQGRASMERYFEQAAERANRNWAQTLHQLAVARQSRARLVRLVRALRAQLTTAWSIEALAEQECKEATILYECAKRYSDELESERDAARAWAAAWKAATFHLWWMWTAEIEPKNDSATYAEVNEYRYQRRSDTLTNQHNNRLRARRAAEAAVAMERR